MAMEFISVFIVTKYNTTDITHKLIIASLYLEADTTITNSFLTKTLYVIIYLKDVDKVEFIRSIILVQSLKFYYGPSIWTSCNCEWRITTAVFANFPSI